METRGKQSLSHLATSSTHDTLFKLQPFLGGGAFCIIYCNLCRLYYTHDKENTNKILQYEIYDVQQVLNRCAPYSLSKIVTKNQYEFEMETLGVRLLVRLVVVPLSAYSCSFRITKSSNIQYTYMYSTCATSLFRCVCVCATKKERNMEHILERR